MGEVYRARDSRLGRDVAIKVLPQHLAANREALSSLYLSGIRTLKGRNQHATDYGLTFGMSWGFGGSPQRPCHC